MADKVAVVGKTVSLLYFEVLADVQSRDGCLAVFVFFIHHTNLLVTHNIGTVEQSDILTVFGDGGGLVKDVVNDFLYVVPVGLVALRIVTEGDGAVVFEQYRALRKRAGLSTFGKRVSNNILASLPLPSAKGCINSNLA